MIKLVETGKVKSVGVSNFSIEAVSLPFAEKDERNFARR